MAASRSRPSPDLIERVRARLAALPLAGTTVSLGYSGGLDSSVLLQLFARLAPELGFHLQVVHVHHGLQAAADAWAAHCQAQAAALGVEFHCIKVEVARHSPQGLEAAARTARHQALRSMGGAWLALAHHRGDQAETLLHRLSRGTGVAGAAAMRMLDPRGGPPALLRPLLAEARQALHAWAQQQGLAWIEDPSNADTGYSRNFIRHQLLAPLSARFPGAEAALARAAEHFAEAAELLDALATSDLATVRVAGKDCAARAALLALSDARLANLLRQRLAAQGFAAPEQARLDEALRQLRCAPALWFAEFGAWALAAHDGEVWIEASWQGEPPAERCWQGEAEIHWAGLRLCLSPDPAGLRLRPGATWLRPRQGGERLRVLPQGPSRSLRALAQQGRLPAHLRARIPVLWQDGEVVQWAQWSSCEVRAAGAGAGYRVSVDCGPRCF